MNRDEIITTLRQHAPELQAAGLAHLRLFGSVARNEATSESDIDLLVDFSSEALLTLPRLTSLQERLRLLLGHSVEISNASWMKARIREQALREAISAF